MKRYLLVPLFFLVGHASASLESCEKLYKAAELGELAKVKSIVQDNPKIAACAGKWGYTPLHGVVTGHGDLTRDDLEIARFLIMNGANVEAKTEGGVTPLHITPYPAMIELLVKSGASLETTDNYGGTAILYYAEDPYGLAPLKKALELGANVHHRDKSNKSALDVVTDRRESQKIELLKRYGAK